MPLYNASWFVLQWLRHRRMWRQFTARQVGNGAAELERVVIGTASQPMPSTAMRIVEVDIDPFQHRVGDAGLILVDHRYSAGALILGVATITSGAGM